MCSTKEVIHYFVDGGNWDEMDRQQFSETQAESDCDGGAEFFFCAPLDSEQCSSSTRRFLQLLVQRIHASMRGA